MDECLFSLQADSSSVVHRLRAASISNDTIELADGHCLFLDEAFTGSVENVTFRGGALVVYGTCCTFSNCNFEQCTLVAKEGTVMPTTDPLFRKPSSVCLNNVFFLSSVLEGAGIGIYASQSSITAIECKIAGGWQGVAAHKDSTVHLADCLCENARLIGLESYCSQMALNHTICHNYHFNIMLSDAKCFEEVVFPEAMARRYNTVARAMAHRYNLPPETVEPRGIGGMLFGALFVHGRCSQPESAANLQACDSVLSGFQGVIVRNSKAMIDDSGLYGLREGLKVSHGGECRLEECAVSHEYSVRHVSDIIEVFTTVQVSGHDSMLCSEHHRWDFGPVLVQKGARAHLSGGPFSNTTSEGQEHYVSSAGDSHSFDEVMIVSSGKDTLHCWGSREFL